MWLEPGAGTQASQEGQEPVTGAIPASSLDWVGNWGEVLELGTHPDKAEQQL